MTVGEHQEWNRLREMARAATAHVTDGQRHAAFLKGVTDAFGDVCAAPWHPELRAEYLLGKRSVREGFVSRKRT